MMDRIGDTCLYVGDRDAAESLQRFNGAKITHILTVDNTPLKWIQETGSFKYLYHQCLDMDTEDLLSHFEDMFKFIDEASDTHNGKVLIHCFAGVSRSVTIAVAYMMYKSKIPLECTLEIVRKYRGKVKPNPGFMRQLELFEQMGCKIDNQNAGYRQYKLEVMAQNIQSGSIEVKESDLAESVGSNKTEDFYKCMKCRQALFRTSSILPHMAGEGEAAFDWRSKIPANKRTDLNPEENSDTVCNRSLFIEPVQWMAEFINQLEGKGPWYEQESNYQIMFKLGMGETPTIPENLSDEGKDFLSHCFEQEPDKRWTASQLRDHPFAKIYDPEGDAEDTNNTQN